jgi:hypothetical protein
VSGARVSGKQFLDILDFRTIIDDRNGRSEPGIRRRPRRIAFPNFFVGKRLKSLDSEK